MSCNFLNLTTLPRVILNNKLLFKQLLLRYLAMRYQGTVLGVVWSLVQPVAFLCVYTFVFSFVLKAKFASSYAISETRGAYGVIMFCGMLLFNIFSESIVLCSRIIVINPNYVKKVIFPLELLPLVQVITVFIFGSTYVLLLLIGIICVMPAAFSWNMLYIFWTFSVLFFLTCGISFFVAAAGIFLRDLPHFLAIVTHLLSFATPIFYPLAIIPEKFRWILLLNPLTWIVEETRRFFIYGQQPNYTLCISFLVISFVVFHLGYVSFKSFKNTFGDLL